MDVKLEDKPSGCLAGLNSSCQDIVVARTLLGNVTARNGSGGIHSSEDVVCVAESTVADIVANIFKFFAYIFDDEVKFRCCKVVDNQGGLNLIPECNHIVQKGNWYKAFYVVLNVLTFFVGLYSPAILFVLPHYIFDLRKECEKEHQECEKEHQQEKEQRLKQNGYLPLLSSQETREESINVTDVFAIASEGMMSSTNELNVNEATGNEANLNGPNSNEPNLNELTSDKGKDEEEERKINEFPVDDGSPLNISTLLYKCRSAEVFKDYSTKLSFNIKLAFLWFVVIPFLFYIELALSYILKDEYLEEIGKKVWGLALILDMPFIWVSLIISYLIIPFVIILILKPNDLSEERTRESISKAEKKRRLKKRRLKENWSSL